MDEGGIFQPLNFFKELGELGAVLKVLLMILQIGFALAICQALQLGLGGMQIHQCTTLGAVEPVFPLSILSQVLDPRIIRKILHVTFLGRTCRANVLIHILDQSIFFQGGHVNRLDSFRSADPMLARVRWSLAA